MSNPSIFDQLHDQGNSIALSTTDLPPLSALSESFDDDLKRALLLDPGPLTIDPSGDLDQSGNAITFSGTAAGILGLTDPVTISVEITHENDVVQSLRLEIDPGAGWTFPQSFPYLPADPFGDLALDSPTFVYTTGAIENYAGPGANPISLVPGMNFAALLDPDSVGIPALIADVLPASALPFYGPITPGFDFTFQGTTVLAPLPQMRLQAALEESVLSIANFTLSAPRLQLEIPQGDPTQGAIFSVAADLELDRDGGDPISYEFYTPLISGLGLNRFFLVPETEASALTLGDLADWTAGAGGLNDLLPDALADLFGSIGLKGFSLGLDQNLAPDAFSLRVGTTDTWSFGSLDVTDLDLIVDHFSSLGGTTQSFTSAYFEALLDLNSDLFEGGFKLQISVDGDSLNVSGEFVGEVPLGTLLQELSGTAVKAPDGIELTFTEFSALFSESDGNLQYTLFGNSELEIDFTLASQTVTGSFNIEVNSDGSNLSYFLFGGILLGENYFQASLELGSDFDILEANWQALSEDSYLQLQDLFDLVGVQGVSIPENLDLALDAIGLTYDFDSGELTIAASSANYGNAIFVYDPNAGDPVYFFGLAIDRDIDLSNLPLIDKTLSDEEKLAVSELQFYLSSQAISGDLAAQINTSVAGEGFPLIPAQGISAGLGFSLLLDFGGDQIPISLGSGGDGSSTVPEAATIQPQPVQGDKSAVQVPDSSAPDGTTWFKVQKKFGPVSFTRVGFRYEDGALKFELDGALQLGGLSLSVEGLSAKVPLDSFAPTFSFSGLGLEYSNPSLEVAGALLKQDPPQAPADFEFAGALIARAGNLSLSAIGAYAQVYGQTSLFVFADVREPLGGPPYFFITGLVGGFGYNSQLRIPAIDEVADFPFVQGLSNVNVLGGTNPNPLDVLDNVLGADTGNPWITPQVGDGWLAAGLEFSTFGLVNSTAVVTAAFGSDLKVAIIGLSKARFPKTGNKTYAYVELELEAVFAPSEGVVSFQAQLSDNSFLLDQACKLTGGYAMYFWYGDSPQAGDFVITLGGYSPYFKPPSWYPQVPRLGFNWNLDSRISITGEAYYALTPSALMAGGLLDAKYEHKKLKAWFKAYADIIVWWNPFRFIAEIGISIGASYKLKVGFIHKTFKVELGADLKLWGPPTGGKVKVHWWVVTIKVEFGADLEDQAAVQDWPTFSEMLPAPEDAVKFNALSGQSADPSGKDEFWVARPGNFSFETRSAIPASQLDVGEGSPFNLFTGDSLNIRPMQKTDLVSSQRISLWNSQDDEIDLADTERPWTIEAVQQSVPKALWGSGSNDELDAGDQQLIADQFIGFRLRAPQPALGHGIGPVPGSILASTPLPGSTLPLDASIASNDPPEVSESTIAKIAELADGERIQDRKGVVQAVESLLGTTLGDSPLFQFASLAGELFADEPLLVPGTAVSEITT